MRKRIIVHIAKTAETVCEYMSTRIGKEKILNPDGYSAIVDVCHSPKRCANEVRRRFGMYIDSYLKSDKVVRDFTLIQKDMEIFYKETNLTLNAMQNKWSSILKDDKDITSEEATALIALGIVAAVVYIPFGLPLLVFALTAGLNIFSLESVRVVMDLFSDEDQKKRAIDAEYENCREIVHQTVRVQLEKNAGTVLEKLIVKVTENELPRRIGALEELIKQLRESRQKIIDKRNMLEILQGKIIEMEKSILKFQKELK